MALLTAKSTQQAAAEAGVGEKTLRTWLAEDADFQKQYAEARRAAFAMGMARVQALTAKAVDTLDDLLSADTAPAVRLGAARALVELALHVDDAETIMERLDAIERAQQER